MVKTIANTFYLANVASHPHNLEFRCAAAAADALQHVARLARRVGGTHAADRCSADVAVVARPWARARLQPPLFC